MQAVALCHLKGVPLHVPLRGAAGNFRCVPTEGTFEVVRAPLRHSHKTLVNIVTSYLMCVKKPSIYSNHNEIKIDIVRCLDKHKEELPWLSPSPASLLHTVKSLISSLMISIILSRTPSSLRFFWEVEFGITGISKSPNAVWFYEQKFWEIPKTIFKR